MTEKFFFFIDLLLIFEDDGDVNFEIYEDLTNFSITTPKFPVQSFYESFRCLCFAVGAAFVSD